MKILLVSATSFELTPSIEFLRYNLREKSPHFYSGQNIEVKHLITGVGLTHTAFSLGKLLSQETFDLAINAGIAGAVNSNLQLGEVVQITSEQFADLGIENADGSFSDVFSLELMDKNQVPFKNGLLINEEGGTYDFLPKVKGISVNKVHGSAPSIQALRKNFDAEVESMEGAAFFYACLMEKISFLQIRSISNYVEARNKENWNIPLAIENLNKVLIQMLEAFIK